MGLHKRGDFPSDATTVHAGDRQERMPCSEWIISWRRTVTGEQITADYMERNKRISMGMSTNKVVKVGS